MNEKTPRRPTFLLALLLGLALAGCGGREAAGTPPLQGASMGGHFTLTDQNGRRISDAVFAGRYRIVYFGYTFCPDVCPTDLQVIGAGLRQFEAADPARAARVQPIFISVDPERDTPAVLRQFVAAFHPRMIGLTGTPAEIAAVAHEYRIFYEHEPPGPGGAYLVNHSRMAVLYGPVGQPLAVVPYDQGPAGVAAELDRRVR
jgi:protein SCO1/2